ncbi:hypothetical protein H0A58_09475 [Alcaligenaceae bacterium]|nr:hypothetical protein [Alcaligenaceae bacterium]
MCTTSATYAAQVAAAGEAAAPSQVQSDWALQVTPYLWAAGLDGKISPFRRGPTIGVDKSFSDVLDDLKIGGFINIWGRYDRYVLSGDIVYVNTKESQAAGPLPPVGPTPPGTVVHGSVDSKQFMATLLGGYRVLDTPDFTLDALGGVRFWHISNKVNVSALGLSRSYKENFGWIEPVIGARTFIRLTDSLSLQAQADIGGFGAGSDLSWSALATMNYAFTDAFSVSAGYKVLDVDYDHKGHVYDTRLRGPIVGLTYRF